MKITDIEIRACSVASVPALERVELHGGSPPDVVVLTLRTDTGIEGTSFAFGGLDANIAGAAYAAIKPFFLGRDPFARERNVQEFRPFDRSWNHVPIYAYGPFDIACWDIVGKAAGLPIHQLLGSSRDRVPMYVSSMFLGSADDYGRQAAEAKEKGFKGYKLHPPGPVELDLEAYESARAAVGPDFNLMADPVAMYTYEEALRVGRRLEELGYRWLEEPFYDYDFTSLQKLNAKLDLPIAGTETVVGGHISTAQFIASRAVDIVRTDVSWRGGIGAVMKTAHLAEAFGMQCELHTTIYHALEVANLQCSLAISNCEFFEVLYPTEQFAFGMKEGLRIEDGYILPPDGPGLGIDYDWDAIEDATVAIV
jgi:L-alanine-DL-glutamate epimerase-like enolase superfamily enzyme